MLMTVIFYFEGKYFYNLSEKNQNFLFWLKKPLVWEMLISS